MEEAEKKGREEVRKEGEKGRAHIEDGAGSESVQMLDGDGKVDFTE
jgi:hypothetical protein